MGNLRFLKAHLAIKNRLGLDESISATEILGLSMLSQRESERTLVPFLVPFLVVFFRRTRTMKIICMVKGNAEPPQSCSNKGCVRTANP